MTCVVQWHDRWPIAVVHDAEQDDLDRCTACPDERHGVFNTTNAVQDWFLDLWRNIPIDILF